MKAEDLLGSVTFVFCMLRVVHVSYYSRAGARQRFVLQDSGFGEYGLAAGPFPLPFLTLTVTNSSSRQGFTLEVYQLSSVFLGHQISWGRVTRILNVNFINVGHCRTCGKV